MSIVPFISVRTEKPAELAELVLTLPVRDIAHQAVNPPGEAWSDFKIFSEYAHRMGFQDKDGNPLIKWRENPEEAFEHWKSTTKVASSPRDNVRRRS